MRLTREQHRAIMAERFPRIAGEGECPVQAGEVIDLTSRVAIRVDGVRTPKGGGWELKYTRIDFRDLYLMPTVHSVAVDESGFPKPMSQAEEHGMNANPRDPVGAGGVLDARYQQVIDMKARAKWMQQKRQHQADTEAEQDIQAVQAQVRDLIRRGTKLGLSPETILAPLSRELERLHTEIDEAA